MVKEKKKEKKRKKVLKDKEIRIKLLIDLFRKGYFLVGESIDLYKIGSKERRDYLKKLGCKCIVIKKAALLKEQLFYLPILLKVN